MCDCPEGGGDVTATWSVPELCGWENVVPTVSLSCLTCTTAPPAPDPLSQLTSSQQISFPVRDLIADNYTIEISATNVCGDITRRSCVGKQKKLKFLATFAMLSFYPTSRMFHGQQPARRRV